MAKGENNARQQAQQANQEYTRAQQQYEAPDPDVVAARERRQRWRDWYQKGQYDTASPDGPLYATEAEVNSAVNKYLDRRGTGITAAAGSASPTLLALSRQKAAMEMGERTATGRTNALIARNAEVEGSALPYIQLSEAHRQFALQQANQNRMQANGLLTQRLSSPSPWWGIGAAGIGAAGSIWGGYLARPRTSAPTAPPGRWF